VDQVGEQRDAVGDQIDRDLGERADREDRERDTAILPAVLLGVFIARLMVGRTPTYLGKSLGPREMKLVAMGTIGVPWFTLAIGTLAVARAARRSSPKCRRARRERLRLRVAGVQQRLRLRGTRVAARAGERGRVRVTFAELAGGVTMLAGRYVPMIAALAVAGSLAPQRVRATRRGKLRTDTLTFATVLV
jgi:K+-transporting ATPase ATPase A chain